MLSAELGQFIGTTNYYKHWLGIKYTDGVQYLAEKVGAYWLIDAIASYKRSEPFQVWTLAQGPDGKGAVLSMVEDTGQPVKVSQDIPFTDFPFNELPEPMIKLYLIDGVLLLPSEY